MVEKNTWTVVSESIRKNPKWLKQGTTIIVEAEAPVRTTVKGKFGDRDAYIIKTTDFGYVYVTPLQVVAINNAFKADFSSAITFVL